MITTFHNKRLASHRFNVSRGARARELDDRARGRRREPAPFIRRDRKQPFEATRRVETMRPAIVFTPTRLDPGLARHVGMGGSGGSKNYYYYIIEFPIDIIIHFTATTSKMADF
jgi:hypothetical protein